MQSLIMRAVKWTIGGGVGGGKGEGQKPRAVSKVFTAEEELGSSGARLADGIVAPDPANAHPLLESLT
jgi:hypothetical protein